MNKQTVNSEFKKKILDLLGEDEYFFYNGYYYPRRFNFKDFKKLEYNDELDEYSLIGNIDGTYAKLELKYISID